jgi:hypothetical protein
VLSPQSLFHSSTACTVEYMSSGCMQHLSRFGCVHGLAWSFLKGRKPPRPTDAIVRAPTMPSSAFPGRIVSRLSHVADAVHLHIPRQTTEAFLHVAGDCLTKIHVYAQPHVI